MKTLNNKLSLLKHKLSSNDPISIMIIGLGSVGCYLLDYLISLGDPQIRIIVVGRNFEKMQTNVNIIRTATTIRKQCRSEIKIIGGCDLNDISSIAKVLNAELPDFIVNTSRAYSGLKYGSISWNALRAYGLWTPLSIRYARNIMEAYAISGCEAITINTSYSDAVIPWLKSAGRSYFDFGSGNLNHLIPRIKFYIAEQFNIHNLNDIDVTIATSHFHDVVISKEGHSEGQDVLLEVKYNGEILSYEMKELLEACAISMPSDQKRNMMNASSNFNIIESIITGLRNNTRIKIHSPGVNGEIGGYPVIISGNTATIEIDDSIWSLDDMRNANKKSIYLDGVEDISNGHLLYTNEIISKVKDVFNVNLPKSIKFEDIDIVADYIINNIIEACKLTDKII